MTSLLSPLLLWGSWDGLPGSSAWKWLRFTWFHMWRTNFTWWGREASSTQAPELRTSGLFLLPGLGSRTAVSVIFRALQPLDCAHLLLKEKGILACSIFQVITIRLFGQLCSSYGAFLVAQTVKCLPTVWETWVRSLDWKDPLERAMAPHSSTLAWKIPWMEEPSRLQSMGSQRVR